MTRSAKATGSLGGAILCAIFLLAARPGGIAALPRSGIVAAEVDDDTSLPAFLSYLDSGAAAAAHEDLPVAGRVLVRIVDEAGRPVPFASCHVTAGGAEICSGRAFADGTFPVYPPASSGAQAAPGAAAWRVELAARGAASVVSTDPKGKGELRLELRGARPLPSPLACDLVFVLDTTVSMAPELDQVKRAFLAACESTAALSPPVSLRLGLVLFRDHGDEYLTKSVPLSADPAGFKEALARAAALGGGDIPEDLGAGLRAAVTGMDYAPDSLRLVFAITDAVPAIRPGDLATKGSRYADVCRAALASGIRIYTIGMGKPALGGEYALRQIAQYTGAAYLAAERTGGPAYGALDAGAVGVSAGLVRGDLEAIIARIVAGEAAAVGPGGAGARDPALDLLDAVQARMAAGLRYPEAARLRGTSGTARVLLRVAPDGRLGEARIAASAGSGVLDRAALDLARSVFPLDNPAASEVQIEIAVTYRLQ
jgi:TonB family protein